MSYYDHGAPIQIETKAVSESDDAWTVTGYASIFSNLDRTNDVVMPGAFKKSLEKHGLPVLLWNHKHDDAPLGLVVDAREDKKGLWFRAELPKDDTFVSGRIIPQLKRRGLKGVSIGYKATEKETRRGDGARLLKQIRLYEISITSMPANELAMIETVKSFDPAELDLSEVADELQRLVRHIRYG